MPEVVEVNRSRPALASGTHVLLRVGVGLLFLQHGLQKLFGMFGGMPGMPGGTVPLGTQLGVAGVLECIGGIALVIGLLVRPVALVLFVEMLAAYAIAHVPRGGAPIQNGGEAALLFALAFAYFAGHGAGAWSVDSALARARAERRANRYVPTDVPAGEGRARV